MLIAVEAEYHVNASGVRPAYTAMIVPTKPIAMFTGIAELMLILMAAS